MLMPILKMREVAHRSRWITNSSFGWRAASLRFADVGSDTAKTLALRAKSAKNEIIAPRFFVYPMFGAPKTPELARQRVRELKAMGADGIKLMLAYRDIMEAMEDEASQTGSSHCSSHRSGRDQRLGRHPVRYTVNRALVWRSRRGPSRLSASVPAFL